MLPLLNIERQHFLITHLRTFYESRRTTCIGRELFTTDNNNH